MYKVEKHILECQNEVKSNIFHEAFSLIHHTAFHHPHDHATNIEYKDEHDDFAHRNFSLTEQDILKFFENHDHNLKPIDGHSEYEDLHTHPSAYEHAHEHEHEHEHAHALHHSIDENAHAHSHSHHHTVDDNPLTIDEHSHHHHTLNEHLHQPHAPQSIVHYPKLHDWQQSHLANIHKKTDAVQQTGKPDGEQRLLKTITTKQNPYTYFDIKTGTTLENQEQLGSRRSDVLVHAADVHHHHSDIHPTTASFKDKRIAGVSIK